MKVKKEVLMKFGFRLSFLIESSFRITKTRNEEEGGKEKPALSLLKYLLGLIIPILAGYIVQGFLRIS